MIRKLAYILLLGLSCFVIATSLASAAEPEQSHKLSEIHPMDELAADFNASNKDIFNVSEFRLRNGLQFDGTAIQTPSNVNILQWDSGNSEWDVKNARLDMNGNDIGGINRLGRQGELNHIWPDSSDNSDLEIGYNSNGNVVLGAGTTKNLTSVRIQSGNLDLNNTGKIINLQDPTNTQDAATKNYVDNNDDTGTDDQTLSTSGDDITIENGNTITFDDDDASTRCSGSNYLAGDGSCNSDTDTDNQNLGEVLSQGNSAGSNNLNMNDNVLENAVISPFSWLGTTSIIGHYNNYFIGADERWSVSSSTCSSGEIENIFDNTWNSNCGLTDSELPTTVTIDFNKANPHSLTNDFGKMLLYFEYGRYASTVKVERYYTGGDDSCSSGNEAWNTLYENTNFNSKQVIIDNLPEDGDTCRYRLTVDGTSNYADDIRISSWNMYINGDRATEGGVLRKSGDAMYGDIDMSGNRITNLADPSNAQDAATKNYVDNNDATGTDDQTLGEVLSQGNTANQDIDMGGYGVTGAGYVKTNYLYANSGNDLVLQNDGASPVLRINSGTNKVTMKGDIDMSGNVINNVDKFSTSRIPDIEPFYIKGTGLNNNANRVVEIGGTQVVSNSCRGLQLVVVQKSDHSVTQNTCYDTFGTASDSDNLEGNLTNLGNGEIGILTSYDAWEDSVDSGLDDAFKSRGLYKAYSTPNTGSRRPYAAIFEGASSTDNAAKATEVLFTDDGSQPHAEIRGFLVDGSFMAEGSKQSNLAGNQGKDIAISADSSQNVQIPNGNLDLNSNKIIDGTGGNISIGGELRVEGGKVWVDNSDLAEHYKSPQKLDKGELVKVSNTKDNSVERTEEKYDEVTGIVSTAPGYVLNSNSSGYPIALTGKVPVKISETNGEIQRGDRIVPSGKPGVGMTCEIKPLDETEGFEEYKKISEQNRKCRDSTIGKALENSNGKTKILVKVSGG